MAEDRFRSKRNRCRQSDAIDADEAEGTSVHGFDRQTKAMDLANRLRDCLAHPMCSFPPPWSEEFARQLSVGNYQILYERKISLMERALDIEAKRFSGEIVFIGPIQRKPKKPMTEATRKWRANAAALESMQATRPLKPPRPRQGARSD